MNGNRKDLVLLVPDNNVEAALRGILSRRESLQIRAIAYDAFVHPERDPGCLRKATGFLRSFSRLYGNALVVLDHQGCGREHESRETLEAELESSLSNAGWGDRAAALVLQPELESWVWADSPHVSRILGWRPDRGPLRDWLDREGFAADALGKPQPPKAAMERVLRTMRRPRSSAIYLELARRVGLRGCRDDAFLKLGRCLKEWFPARH